MTHTLSGDHRDQVNIFTTIVNIVLHILHTRDTRDRSPRRQMWQDGGFIRELSYEWRGLMWAANMDTGALHTVFISSLLPSLVPLLPSGRWWVFSSQIMNPSCLALDWNCRYDWISISISIKTSHEVTSNWGRFHLRWALTEMSEQNIQIMLCYVRYILYYCRAAAADWKTNISNSWQLSLISIHSNRPVSVPPCPTPAGGL